MDPIETQLEEIRIRYLSGNLISPAQASTRKHVSFLIHRLEHTEKLAARYLSMLQKHRYGKVAEEVRRLQTVRQLVTESIDMDKKVGDPPAPWTPKEAQE